MWKWFRFWSSFFSTVLIVMIIILEPKQCCLLHSTKKLFFQVFLFYSAFSGFYWKLRYISWLLHIMYDLNKFLTDGFIWCRFKSNDFFTCRLMSIVRLKELCCNIFILFVKCSKLSSWQWKEKKSVITDQKGKKETYDWESS